MPEKSRKGILIVVEGIDGTGKSTQVKRLGQWLRERGNDVVLSREPTDGPWGRKLRESATTGRMAPEDELDCFLKDRRQHVEELIQPALTAGKTVLLDRYYFSTMAYQGARGLDPDEIRRRNEVFAPKPDLLLILDLDPATSHRRIGQRGDTTNEFEQIESLKRCREIFLSLAHEPFAHVIDTDQTLDAVSDRIVTVVSQSLEQA